MLHARTAARSALGASRTASRRWLHAPRAARMGNSAVVQPPATGHQHLWAWGSAKHGALMGEPPKGKAHALEPVEAVRAAEALELPDDSVVQCSVGATHAGFVSASGALYTVGEGKYGKLGHGSADDVKGVPRRVDGIPGRVRYFSAGHFHSAAVTEEGHVYTWGWGGSLISGVGALGLGSRANRSTPQRVEALVGHSVRQVECGQFHTLALTRDGAVYSWGRGEGGRLGTSSTSDAKSPQLIEMLAEHRVSKVGVGRSFSAAITERGHVYTWGRNNASQLGNPSDFNMDVLSMEKTPCLVESLVDGERFISDLSVGSRHVLALDADGDIWFWGEKQWPVPRRVTDHFREEGGKRDDVPKRFVAISGGHKYSAAVDDRGRVWTWGQNKSGTLGQGWVGKMVRVPGLVKGFGSVDAPCGKAVGVACGKSSVVVIARGSS